MSKNKIRLKNEAKKNTELFADFLKSKNFAFKNIYLYGSFARGDFHRDSDIDVCIVSDKFKRDSFNQEVKIGVWGSKIDPRLEPIGLTVNEFKNEIHPLASEIKMTGIKIK